MKEYHTNIFDNKFLIIYEKEIQAIENLINTNKQLEKECLHCGSGEPSYCEKCYQELIGINAKLQEEN